MTYTYSVLVPKMPKIFLPNHGGFAYYHIPTQHEFYKVKVWGLSKEAFEIALAFHCVDKIEGISIPKYTNTSYETLRQLMLALPPDDEGVLVEEILRATATHYAK